MPERACVRFDFSIAGDYNSCMEKKAVHTESGPVANAPYSPQFASAIESRVGAGAIEPATSRVVEGAFEDQVRQCLRNLAAVLKQEGLSLENVVKTTVFLTDLNNFAEMNRIYGPYFNGVRPARSCVQISRLPLDVMVEIEAIAVA